MKLNMKAYDNAMNMIASKAVSLDETYAEPEQRTEMCSLGIDETDAGTTYHYAFAKDSNGSLTCFPHAFKAIKMRAKEAGHEDVGNAAESLMEMACKEFPQLREPGYVQPAKSKKSVIAQVIRDAKFIATLEKSRKINKDSKKSHNGFWALASVENPQGDSDGDIIVVDGIECDINPEEGRYLPLLPGHKRQLPDGSPAEIGRIEQVVKTSYGEFPALAMYFTFALDEDGKPMDELVAKYYKRYVGGYSNTFSVGMEALDEPERIPTGGYRFHRSKLYEVSPVSIPANPDAIGLTRSAADDEIIQAIKDLFASMDKSIDASFQKAFKPLEDRLDMIESELITKNKPALPVKKEELDIKTELERILSKHLKK